MHLDQNERAKFADWLDKQASDYSALLTEMDKLGTPASMMKKLRTEILAFQVTAKVLRSIETDTVE